MGFLDNEGLQKTLTHVSNNMNFLVNDVRNKADYASTTVNQESAPIDDIELPLLTKYNNYEYGDEVSMVKYVDGLTYNTSTNTLTMPSVKTNKIEDNGGTLNIINNNTSNNSNDYITIESTNGQIDIKSKLGVNVYSNDAIGTISANLSGNATSAGKLSTARTIDGVSFNGSANITHYGVCSTAAGTATKTVSCSGFTLATGARIFVKFNNTNTNTTTSLALNVNSTGAKPIKYRGALPSSLPGKFVTNSVWEFVYDGTNYEVIGEIDSDTKVSQTSNSTDSNFPLLLKNSSGSTSETASVNYNSDIRINPSKKYMSGVTTISPFTDGDSNGVRNNEVVYSSDNICLNLHGSIIETGLYTNIGTTSTQDYVCVAEIFIVGTTPGDCDAPITFQISARKETCQNRVHVTFNRTDSTTQPTTATVVYELPWSHEIYLVKPNTSPGNDRWHLVVKQMTTAYDNIDLIRVSIPAYVKNVVKVTTPDTSSTTYWTASQWSSLSATKIKATLIGY